MASAYKGVVISPSLTKTAGGQDLYVPLVPSSGGGDVFPGNVQIAGNLAVGGTTSLSGAVSTGALTPASVTTSGSVSAATVTAAGSVSAASVTASGSVSAATVTSSGAITGASLILPSAGAVSNSAGSVSAAPSSRGLVGSYAYSLSIPGTQNQNAIGLAPLINTNTARVFAVSVTVAGFPTAYASALLCCSAGTGAPFVVGKTSGNGIAWPSDPTGVPGNYDLTLNSSLAPATITLNVVLSPLA